MRHNHICGLYFNEGYKRFYLPQVELKSHTTINPVSFTTTLKQTFDSPNEAAISQVRYTFPLYDGVAVNAYSISYADKVIHGIVQQKDEAKKTYQAAVDRGETAGLLESLPAGVFGVTLGNVPAKTSIVVDITYCGELKHDAAIDGLRYMLPASIAPRYGNYPGEVLKSNATSKGGISITVDVDMASSAIRKVQSPSHPIAVSMGVLSTAEEGDKAPFDSSQASATLTRGSTELADDFVLQLLIDDTSKPQAILETHPELPNQRALMTTLVPKFALESANPEIVFIADQSGSMSGSKNDALVKALRVFLKSLPLGVRFNICAFGNDFKFLFPNSQAYNEANLKTALKFVDSFKAHYGGTEILKPITAAFKQHLSDLPLEVMLLTDGEIWDERGVFDYVNQQIAEKKVDARVFALGIGTDVSHTLVEGVARAGNGFAQFVTQNEDTDQKVVRMLKGALYAHTKEYEIEVHYDDKDEDKMSDEDDFEIVEKVNDCLKITEPPPEYSEKGKSDNAGSKPLSFFDASADLDKPTTSDEPADRYAHLAAIETPKLLQAPNTIPPLFPFNRTTLYLLLGPDTPQKKVTSVTLRAKSPQGPLELSIPVYSVDSIDATTIHQLAARKATQDLEEGRGWLQSASIDNVQVKTKFASRFDELVERECVRLGEKFQVAGKWTSFVAVEDNGEKEADFEERPDIRLHAASGGARYRRSSGPMARKSTGGMAMKKMVSNAFSRYGNQDARSARGFADSAANSVVFDSAANVFRPSGTVSPMGAAAASNASSSFGPGAGFGQAQGFSRLASANRSAPPPPPAASAFASFSSSRGPNSSARLSGASPNSFGEVSDKEEAEMEDDEDMGYGLFDSNTPQPDAAAMAQYHSEMQQAACMPLPDEEDEAMSVRGGSATRSRDRAVAPVPARASAFSSTSAKKKSKAASGGESTSTSSEDAKKMTALIDLQTFFGAWGWSGELLSLLGVAEASVEAALGTIATNETLIATALAVAFLEKRVSGKKEVWQMVVAKANAFLRQELGGGEKAEEFVGKAQGLF